MTEAEKGKIEAKFMMARRVGQARWDEQKRIADHIEMMLYEAQTTEAADALVMLARYVFEGGKP